MHFVLILSSVFDELIVVRVLILCFYMNFTAHTDLKDIGKNYKCPNFL